MSCWSEVRDSTVYEAALSLTRGSYQRAILQGTEALSGSTLQGKAKRFGDCYKRSITNLLSRMTRAGLPWHEETRAHGKRVLVIG